MAADLSEALAGLIDKQHIFYKLIYFNYLNMIAEI